MLKDRLRVEQRELRQQGAEEVEVGFMLGASGINPRFPGHANALVEAIGDGSQAVPCAHACLCEGAHFRRHWDSSGNNGYETSLDQLLDSHPDLLVSTADHQLLLLTEAMTSDEEGSPEDGEGVLEKDEFMAAMSGEEEGDDDPYADLGDEEDNGWDDN